MGVFLPKGRSGNGMALTDVEIRSAKPGQRAYKLHDERGMFLVVTPAGGKLWRWKYRFGGKEKLMSLGLYPDVTLADARNRREDARRMLANGIDPMADRKEKKAATHANAENSFKGIALMWIDHWRADKSARHVDATRRRLEANVFPKLGRRPIADIQPPEITAVVLKINERAPDLAKRALQSIGQIFRFAVARGYAKVNPVSELKPADILTPTQTVNLARIDPAELPMLLRSIEVYRGKTITRLAMKLMLLTFVRTSELIKARWTEIDFNRRRWYIPAPHMKKRKPQIVPLSHQAIEVLEMLRMITGNRGWLFPGDHDPNKSMSNRTILQALGRMGYRGRQTGHGFRGLASTILHEEQFPHEHIELQLAHTRRNAVAAAYDHSLQLGPRTQMMQAWADFLERTQRRGKLLPFGTLLRDGRAVDLDPGPSLGLRR
jgi:integrase